MICPRCGEKYRCGCASCLPRHRGRITFKWDDSGELEICGRCGFTQHCDWWLDEEYKQCWREMPRDPETEILPIKLNSWNRYHYGLMKNMSEFDFDAQITIVADTEDRREAADLLLDKLLDEGIPCALYTTGTLNVKRLQAALSEIRALVSSHEDGLGDLVVKDIAKVLNRETANG